MYRRNIEFVYFLHNLMLCRRSNSSNKQYLVKPDFEHMLVYVCMSCWKCEDYIMLSNCYCKVLQYYKKYSIEQSENVVFFRISPSQSFFACRYGVSARSRMRIAPPQSHSSKLIALNTYSFCIMCVPVAHPSSKKSRSQMPTAVLMIDT